MEFNTNQSTRPPTQAEIDEFVKNTKSHPDVARQFLADCNNSVEWACLLFFQVSDELYEEKGVDVQSECQNIASVNDVPACKKAKIEEIKDEVESKLLDFGLISWNVNGLYKVHCDVRMKELSPSMAKVVDKYLSPIYNIMYERGDYTMYDKYFTAVCVVNTIKVMGNEFLPFKNSKMERGCHLVKIDLLSKKIALINTHLESGKESSAVRVAQMEWCVKKMEELKIRGYDVIFGGDLNIRKEECSQIVSEKLDCFVKYGRPSKYNYTWRGEEIFSKKSDRSFTPKARFDRIYHDGGFLNLSNYEHIGFEWLKKQDCALSDHLGIFTNFQFEPVTVEEKAL
ncbi:Tyrosyl-DNA phosphodiesterase 2 [Strongyloides ratti]|uniref:Tyrosyl-DNA phosphodiesterase 2 n=1 Tax=Strongyloides ratti TaxID=34506 RepID=A0A090LKY3_STRRB|nr:Tyrosyl-DNA phosphodiesterase 2 [Strongyloides ratti]CEF68828.1 Tyrosyl-DNA phosphodiesterase 2 [Strongyloides ratti]